MVPILGEEIRNLLYVNCVIEGRGVADLSLVGRDFALQTLDEMADGHTTGHGMWVHDEIRSYPLTRERHILQKTVYHSQLIQTQTRQ